MPDIRDPNSKRRPRWYFGGAASAGAVFFTHPIDLMKVLLQTQQEKLRLVPLATTVLKEEGILRFYNGISASLVRQMTYTMSRFAIYEIGKSHAHVSESLAGKISLACFAGFVGGMLGTPADMVNVRMQNDIKLPPKMRRNYNHVFDGLVRVCREEGWMRLFIGASIAATRGMLMTVGQLAFYDEIKELLLRRPNFKDNFLTHFIGSLAAGFCATIISQPLDVVKTRSFNAKPGEFYGVWDVVRFTSRAGPLAFYKGFIPSFLRLGPQTVLMFIFLEQLRLNFGYLPEENN